MTIIKERWRREDKRDRRGRGNEVVQDVKFSNMGGNIVVISCGKRCSCKESSTCGKKRLKKERKPAT